MFEYRKYCLNLQSDAFVAFALTTSTFKTIRKWLTELQKIARLAEPACQSAQLALFQKVTSTRSIQTFALTAVLAQTLAQWVQSFQVNNH